ncbi:MAG: Sun protein [Sandaracinaceae bacterium]|nr:Sun protein [Sandaracinaceae bacterium]
MRGRPSRSHELPATTGRELAARVLFRVLDEDAWASPTLDAELSRAHLSPSENGRATDLVYGVLRVLPALEDAIDAHRPRRDPLEPFTLACMLCASYELLHTAEKPWAILDETVGLIRRMRAEGLSRFANAVLRKIAAARPEAPMRASRLVLPRWLEEHLALDLGAERARSFAGDRPVPPPITLRSRRERDAILTAIREARPDATLTLGALSEHAILTRGVGDPRRLPGFDRGDFVVMDEASQLVAEAVGAKSGERVLDACAGRGGKTLAMLDAMGAGGELVACDDHPEKLARMDDELRRLGHAPSKVARHAVDLSVGLGKLAVDSFDRVLVDAPCTGLGTVHRRPEILLRVGPEDVPRMQELQEQILARAAELVRPDGLLVYAVCSPTRAEGIGVVQALLSRGSFGRHARSFELLREPVGPIAPDDDGMIRLGPWCDPSASCDAFQIARLRRRR